MENNVKWVVFDVGGVLLDWHKGLRAVAEYLNIDEKTTLDGLLGVLGDLELGKIKSVDGWRVILNNLGIKDKEPEEVVKIWVDGQPWLEEGWKLVNDLCNSGFSLAICTNNWIGVMEEVAIKRTDFTRFKEIIDSSSEEIRKPDRRIYEIVERRLEAKGDEIYFIDDSENNLTEPKAMGWKTFYYLRGEDGGKVSCDLIRKELNI